MVLMKEISFIFDIHIPKPEVFCKVFKYNQSYISITESKNLSPRTKHFDTKYHRFQSLVQKKIILVCYIYTGEQTAYIFTKPINEALFIYLQGKLFGLCLLKVKPFLLTQGILIIQITTQNHNSDN